ncbi:MAG: GHMP kinase [Eubacteriaceae bacterium]
MREVVVKTPGTCGEYIQGWYKKKPCLVSCPMNRYSIITLREGLGEWQYFKSKTRKMIELFFKRNGIPENEKKHFNLKIDTEIPVGKGMASSTADIAGIITGLSAYFEIKITPEEIGKYCTTIEPSDNLMFPKLNLFNHLSGEILEKYEGSIKTNVLMINFYGGVNTLAFNETQEDYSQKDLESFENIVRQFRNGVAENNLKEVGEACTQSALLNQKRLRKNYLEKVIELSRENQGLGVVIGHSGTVMGVLYEEKNFQKSGFLKAFKKEIPINAYQGVYEQQLIPGGIHVKIKE